MRTSCCQILHKLTAANGCHLTHYHTRRTGATWSFLLEVSELSFLVSSFNYESWNNSTSNAVVLFLVFLTIVSSSSLLPFVDWTESVSSYISFFNLFPLLSIIWMKFKSYWHQPSPISSSVNLHFTPILLWFPLNSCHFNIKSLLFQKSASAKVEGSRVNFRLDIICICFIVLLTVVTSPSLDFGPQKLSTDLWHTPNAKSVS